MKIVYLIAAILAVFVVGFVLLQYTTFIQPFEGMDCVQALSFRKSVLGVSGFAGDIMQVTAKAQLLKGMLPSISSCSLDVDTYVIDDDTYKNINDACFNCAAVFASKQDIIYNLADSITSCWEKFRAKGMEDSDGMLFYDKNPYECKMIRLYLGKESISIGRDLINNTLIHGVKSFGTVSNQSYSSKDLVINGLDRIYFRHASAVEQLSTTPTASFEPTTTYGIEKSYFDDSGTLQIDINELIKSESNWEGNYDFFNYDSNGQKINYNLALANEYYDMNLTGNVTLLIAFGDYYQYESLPGININKIVDYVQGAPINWIVSIGLIVGGTLAAIYGGPIGIGLGIAMIGIGIGDITNLFYQPTTFVESSKATSVAGCPPGSTNCNFFNCLAVPSADVFEEKDRIIVCTYNDLYETDVS